MTVSAGTAYVAFEGDFSAINQQVSSHFSKIAASAGEQGKKAGAALGKGLAVGVGAAGAVAGGLFMKGLNDAIGAEKSSGKLAAQLGLHKKTSARMGKLAGKIYADNYGDGIEDVNDAFKGLIQNGVVMRKASNKELEKITQKALNLSAVFDVDLADSTRGIGQLMRTGLVKNATEAFDIVFKLFQKGGDKAGDALDTLNEYSVQWKKLGLTAAAASGLMIQGLRAGARDTDLVADALKEFTLVVADGGKATEAAFKGLGLDADKMIKAITAGGPRATKALDLTLDRIRKIGDPKQRLNIIKALFGAPGEDLGLSILALDPSKAVGALGQIKGAADKAGNALSDNVASKFEALKRKTFAGFQGVAAKYVLPEFNKILEIVNDPKLKPGEKWSKIGDTISAAIRRSNLDDKLKAVGEQAAKTIWEGFKAAPLWAQVGGGLFLARQLGLTGPAITGMKKLLSGRGGGGGVGGGAAGALGARGSSPANPVWVAMAGGGVGGKGPGGGPIVAGGGGAAAGRGIMSKLRVGGKFLGKLGAWAAAADLAINLVDAKGNPIKAVQNTAHDLTFGLVPEFKGDTEKAKEAVSKIKLKLPVDVQAALPPDFETKLADAQKKIDEAKLHMGSRQGVANVQLAGASPGMQGGIVAQLQKANAADQAIVSEQGKKLGNLYAEQYTLGIQEHHTFFGADQLTKGFAQQLQGLPVEARQAAFDTMTSWANTMVQQGRLPREAFNSLIKNIDDKLGLLPTGITRNAKGAVDNLTAQFKRRDAIAAADAMFDGLEKKYGEMPRLAKTSGDNMASNFLKSISFLREGAMHGTGEFQKQSSKDLKKARDDALKYSGDMKNGLNADLMDAGVKGSKHSKKLRDDIIKAFEEMATGTGTASSTTASTLYTALSNMDVNAEEILSALGIKVPAVKLTRPPLASGNASGKGQMRPTQTGAYMTGGKPTGDSIPVLAERGEYMLNRNAVQKVGKANLDRLNFGDAPRFQAGGLVALTNAADKIDAAGYPYLWGGGHNAAFSGPYDCSGAVSAILHAAGLLSMPMVSGQFMNFGKPGAGQFTIFANEGHVYSKIGNRFWGTSGSNPGGGAGYFEGSARPGFTVRHVDLVDTALKAQNMTGMPGMLQDAGQGIISKTRDAYQDFIDSQMSTLGQIGGGDDGDSVVAAGGGNLRGIIAAGLELAGMAASSGNVNLMATLLSKENPSGSATIVNPEPVNGEHATGFLQMLPSTFRANAVPGHTDILNAVDNAASSARYQVGRYGHLISFSPYRLGGLIARLQKGGKPGGKGKGKDIPNASINPPVKKWVPKEGVTNSMLAALGRVPIAENLLASISQSDTLSKLYADYAQRAETIENTADLQQALNDEAKARGVTSGMSDTKALELFPLAEQSTFIDNWRRKNANVFGRIGFEWYNEELGQLLGWRNTLLVNPPIFKSIADQALIEYNAIREKIKEDEKAIAQYEREQGRIEGAKERHKSKYDDHIQTINDKIDAEQKKKKPDHDRIAQLKKDRHNAKVKYDRERGYFQTGTSEQLIDNRLPNILGHDANGDIIWGFKHSNQTYNHLLTQRKKDMDARDKAADDIGGDDGKSGRIGDLTSAIGTMASSLETVHGPLGTPTELLYDSSFPPGYLGGAILGVQDSINQLTLSKPKAEAPDTGGGDDAERQKQIDAYIIQHQLEQIQSRRIDETLGDAFANLPFEFGGSFKEGGTVPGPIGAPRMILAHGGEVVLSNDTNYAPGVTMQFANGMEWLRQFVTVTVDNQTRTQGRRSERQLPGQGSRR